MSDHIADASKKVCATCRYWSDSGIPAGRDGESWGYCALMFSAEFNTNTADPSKIELLAAGCFHEPPSDYTGCKRHEEITT